MFRTFNRCALVFVALALVRSLLVRSAPKSTKNASDFHAQEPAIKVESDMVLVPVFVFTKYGLERQATADEERCDNRQASKFYALTGEEAFLPIKCHDRELENLSLEDFQLFEDGQPRKIQVGTGSWGLDVRDNRTWHFESSIAPMGTWSTTDLDHSFLPQRAHSFYYLGYVPARSEKGCHQIRVEVRRPKVSVYARGEYCAGQTPSDLLNGTKLGEKLQLDLEKDERVKLPLSVQAGTFRGEANLQRVDVVLEFPWNLLAHSWDQQTGKFDASIGVLGAVYNPEGRLVTRFSDLLWPSYWPAILLGQATEHALDALTSAPGDNLHRWDAAWLPTRYETQFALQPGDYELRVVLSDGKKFARAKVPLSIQNYDAKSLALGSVFLCNRFRDARVAAVETAAANFAPQYVPLVSKGVRFTPAGDTRFVRDTQLSAYFEIYEPQGAVEPAPRIQAHLRILRAKDGALVKDFPLVDAAPYAQPGSTTVPIAREIPISTLANGDYRLEVLASDSSGHTTPWRAANFTIRLGTRVKVKD